MPRDLSALLRPLAGAVAACCIAAVVLTCAAPAPTPGTAPTPTASMPSCSAATSGAAPESASVALSMELTPAHAPAPRNAAERLVFAQLYETLLRVDCNGRVIAGLAQSWTPDATGRRWTIRLRDSIRFWNGDPVTARSILTAWRATSGSTSPAATLSRRLADATTIIDDRTLVVPLADSLPNALAALELAVYRPRADSPWPEGTGSYRVSTGDAGALALLPTVPGVPRLIVRTIRDADARDQIDGGVHLLVTDDPRVVSYADSRADYVSVPLHWDRVYAIGVPGRSASSAAPGAGDDLRRSLARDVVRAEARAAEPPFWWEQVSRCALPANANAATSESSTRIVYERQDHVARQVAERLAALASIGSEQRSGTPVPPVSLSPQLRAGGARATVAGLAPAELAASLRTGNALAFVLALSPASIASCDDAAALLAAAPWLAGGDSTLALLPLIETRARAIVRRNGLSLLADDAATLRIVGGATREAPRVP